jgi:hypothetical protein
MNTCYSTAPFQEAIHHCRWKKVLYAVLKGINILHYKNKSFDEIIVEIYKVCNGIKGIGLLTMYDITSAICRYHQIHIDRVYIIGKGPKRAITLLHMKTKMHRIDNTVSIHYVDIQDVMHAFDSKSYVVDETIRNNKNGDVLETYLCHWQKTQ